MTPGPRLLAITDIERGAFEDWLAALEQLLLCAAPGAVMVLLRDRQLGWRERLRLGHVLRELTRRHGHWLSVNDRLDLAVLCDADAVHLSGSSVAVADARAFGSCHARSWWVSCACHDPLDAATSAADALLLSPVAAPRKGREALGVGGVERACAARAGRVPSVYALGGITAANAASVVAAGADGVALIGALLDPGAPEALARALGIERGASSST